MEDCYELAKIAYSDVDYYHTELWMAQALRQLDEGEESTIDKVTVLDYLSYAIYQQGDIERALEYTKRLLELGESPLISEKYFGRRVVFRIINVRLYFFFFVQTCPILISPDIQRHF